MRQRIMYQFLLEADNEAGRVKNLLHIKQKQSDKAVDSGKVSAHSIVCAAAKVVLAILYKVIYVLLFMYVPYKLLSKISVAEGFQLRQSIVYFTCFLSEHTVSPMEYMPGSKTPIISPAYASLITWRSSAIICCG